MLNGGDSSMLVDVRHQSEEGQGQQAAERADEDKPGHVSELVGSDAQHFGQRRSQQLGDPSAGIGDAHEGSIQGGLHSLQPNRVTSTAGPQGCHVGYNAMWTVI